MKKYWSTTAIGLTPYVPGEQPKQTNLIKLNTNENPYPPSPIVLQALQNAATEKLRLYPDPDSSELRRCIADYYGIETAQVFVGNGSDEVLAHTFQALLKQNLPILFPDITYSFYQVYCNLFGIEFITVPVDSEYRICLDDYRCNNGGIIFANPNAPTGCLLELSEIEKLLAHNTESVVVIDEAYIDFGGQSSIGLINKYPNLLVIQTLSKSRSLAGLRVGFAVGHAGLIEALHRVKNSFNSYPLDRLAIAGAIAAFQDLNHFEQTRQTIIKSRTELASALQALGFVVLPSASNFLFTRHPLFDAEQLATYLRSHNILVRHFKRPRIDHFLRISIGTAQECEALVQKLAQKIKK